MAKINRKARPVFSQPYMLASLGTLVLVLLMVIFPADTLEASLRGLDIWWKVLFPALFPFFVISDMMLGFGIVHFFGKLLDPLMRPLFRLPGISGFIVAMGYVSGYPVGAKLTAQLYEQKLINRTEGERLVAFTTTSDPIFLIGAVSVGFFHNAALAPVLAAAHYGGALVIGFLMRFHDRHAPLTDSASASSREAAVKVPRLKQALRAMHNARMADGRPFGKLLQDSVQSGLRLMIVVGGLVVFFSALMELLTQTGILSTLSDALRLLFGMLGLPARLPDAFIFGTFEVTLGARASGQAGGSLIHQAAAAAWVLSWAGLSVHAQVASLLSRTEVRYKPLLLARLAHAFIAAALVYALWGWLAP